MLNLNQKKFQQVMNYTGVLLKTLSVPIIFASFFLVNRDNFKARFLILISLHTIYIMHSLFHFNSFNNHTNIYSAVRLNNIFIRIWNTTEGLLGPENTQNLLQMKNIQCYTSLNKSLIHIFHVRWYSIAFNMFLPQQNKNTPTNKGHGQTERFQKKIS